jgi:hypothetical protein
VSAHFDDFDSLVAEREREADRVTALLRSAVTNLENPVAAGYGEQALRARGAAAFALQAAQELAALAGAYELAAKVSASGMLEDGSEQR